MNDEILHTWNALNNALINFINQKVQDKELSKDISQDVFIKVFQKIDTLKNKDKIIPWIYQITRNEINTYFRKQVTTQEIKDVAVTEIIEDNLTVAFSKCLRPMINTLPIKNREAIRLVEMEGFSQKEMAKSLDISYSGAKSRVQRGRIMLKSLLQQCCTISTDKYGNIIDYKERKCKTNCN